MPTEAELRALIEKWRADAGGVATGPRDAGWRDGRQECADELESLLRPQEPSVFAGRIEFADPLTGEPRWRMATVEEAAAEAINAVQEPGRDYERLGRWLAHNMGSVCTALSVAGEPFRRLHEALKIEDDAFLSGKPGPEQAARERLAAFLLSHEGAYYERLDTSVKEKPFRIALASVYMLDEHEDAFNPVDVNGATLSEAINAALDAAERNGR